MAGANDLGGTLINESISTAAGARFGQWMRPAELRRAIREAGRTPAERSTSYKIRHRFEAKEDDGDKAGALDRLSDSEAERFGSFNQMIHSSEFRFREKATPVLSQGE